MDNHITQDSRELNALRTIFPRVNNIPRVAVFLAYTRIHSIWERFVFFFFFLVHYVSLSGASN